MNAILPIFTALAAALMLSAGCGRPQGNSATPGATTANVPAPPADPAVERLVIGAIANADAQNSISGKIRHKIDLFGHQLIGSGTYLQQGRGDERKLRLELKLQVDDQHSSLQQVCDGMTLWTHQDLLGKATLSQVDLRRVRNALLDRPNVTAPAPAVWTALGGLPKLLKSLHESFAFHSAKAVQLDGLAMWSIDGGWRPAKLAELLPSQKEDLLAGKGADLSVLPEHVPHRVVLFVGQDDLFPYCIEYWGSKPRSKKSPQGEERKIVVMELFEVQTDAPLDPRQFIYNAGDLKPEDQTNDFLHKLGLSDTRAETIGVRGSRRARR